MLFVLVILSDPRLTHIGHLLCIPSVHLDRIFINLEIEIASDCHIRDTVQDVVPSVLMFIIPFNKSNTALHWIVLLCEVGAVLFARISSNKESDQAL